MQLNGPLTISSQNQNTSLTNMNPAEVRDLVQKATLDFKNSWRNLAQALFTVFTDKLYRNWGYDKFDQYTEKEVHIRKHTAMKLIRSYAFLEKEEESLYIADETEDKSSTDRPSLTLEAADILRKAKRSLDDDGYKQVKKDIIHRGKNQEKLKRT